MTSIIGYTRVPFNPTCSIAPVQRILMKDNRPHFHRIFSREANGIMELIGEQHNISDKKKDKQASEYNTFLSIDITLKQQDFEEEEVDISKLMIWISSLAYENSMKLKQIIDLLKRLQHYEDQYKFVSRIDKEIIFIYFPNTISNVFDWLQNNLQINIHHYKNWHLHTTTEQQHEQEFDGQSYFKDIHKFIDQVDALIESNALFSHNKKNQ